MANPYEPAENFHSRLKVETTYPDGKRDHREDFTQQEYRRNMQDKSDDKEPMAGFPPMKGVTEAPKPKAGTKRVRQYKKTKEDEAVEQAVKKDHRKRNLK